MIFLSKMQFSVYGFKEPLNITRFEAFQRCQWGFVSYRILCRELGNCLPTYRDSNMISSTTEDKTLNIVFRFMWTNIMFKVHSCRCKCSFVSTKHCIHFKYFTLKPFLNYRFFLENLFISRSMQSDPFEAQIK